MHSSLISSSAGSDAVPLWLATEATLSALLGQLPDPQAAWLRAQGFAAERHRVQALPGANGEIAGAVLGLGSLAGLEELTLWEAAALPERLPAGDYVLATPLPPRAATQLLLGWLVGGYRFQRYRTNAKPLHSRLVMPAAADLQYAEAMAAALAGARDLINTPANDLGPLELAAAAAQLAQEFGGEITVHEGEALRTQFPLIHAVGSGSPRPPRLVDCRWRRAGAPRVTLVGKGVCFDTGGLDLKPAAGMLLMKKDMGGAACALALARVVLALAVPIDLRLLIPAVENSIDGHAFRPGDVCRSRKGLTVEIGNTDAEGRLVLADALALADEERPDLLIDLATLTGAARTALGPDLPAVFGTDDALLLQLRDLARAEGDPVWPLPLWTGYDEELNSRVADLNNVASNTFAGAVFGALFLRRFVTATSQWLHLDIFAWNHKDRPGRPLGAEAQAVRALYALIRARFG
jgi:leucyl aminopeptidase